MGARFLTVAALFIFAGVASAHVGSPDVYFQGEAGPYKLLIAIRAPDVIPGVARVEVQAISPGVREVELTPTPMTGPASTHPPTADVATRSASDPQYFEGSLWLMTSGSWKVRVHAVGPEGAGDLQVPVPSVALRVLPMEKGVSYFLFGMMIFLTAGMVAIVGAGIREARLEPGTEVRTWNARTLIGMAAASVLLIGGLWWAKGWWAEDAASASERVYKPLNAVATLAPPDTLQVHLVDPGWVVKRSFDNLIPDHGHVMHLFLVRWPAMDRMYHLHPREEDTGFFETTLPSLPKGDYRIYADIVHQNGFAETAVGDIEMPDVTGHPLQGDDAGGVIVPGLPGSPLEDGYRMVWIHDGGKPITAKQLTLFSFSINGPDGRPVDDLEPYMGMGGHAEFVKTDGSVFAHVHPSGSVSMAAEQVASGEGMMAMHEAMPETSIGPTVSFPFGLPSPGSYRMFVQMKRAGRIETGAFDLTVAPAPSGK